MKRLHALPKGAACPFGCSDDWTAPACRPDFEDDLRSIAQKAGPDAEAFAEKVIAAGKRRARPGHSGCVDGGAQCTETRCVRMPVR